MPNDNHESKELLELLINDADDIFKENFESFLSRWPKVRDPFAAPGKTSFIHGLINGMVISFMGTELAENLRIERTYLSIGKKAINKAFFLIKENDNSYRAVMIIFSGVKKQKEHESFYKEEWSSIRNMEENVDLPEHINVAIKNVVIDKYKKEQENTSKNFKINVESKAVGSHELSDPPECYKKSSFILINRQVKNDLERHIRELSCVDDETTVKVALEGILRELKKSYDIDRPTTVTDRKICSRNENEVGWNEQKKCNYKGYYRSVVFRKEYEAIQHGHVIGFFSSYKYRYNIGIFPEISSGNGYVDTVILVRGKDKCQSSIPIIIEHKQGTGTESTPENINKPFNEAKDYALGFQRGGVPFLTYSKKRIFVGINLDLDEAYKMDSLTVKSLNFDFIRNFFEEKLVSESEQDFIERIKIELREHILKIKNTLMCSEKSRDGKCKTGDYMISNIFHVLLGNIFLYHPHQMEIENDRPEDVISNLFICKKIDETDTCKKLPSSLSKHLSQAGIVLIDKSKEPKKMAIFNLYQDEKENKALPLDKIKGLGDNMGAILNNIEPIFDNKILIYSLVTNKPLTEIIDINQYPRLTDYNDNYQNSFEDNCMFTQIPFLKIKELNGNFIKAACSLLSEDKNRISEQFDEFFKKTSEVFRDNYFYSGDEKKFEMINLGLFFGYASLVDNERKVECNVDGYTKEITNFEVLNQYQMGYNDGVIDLLIKLDEQEKPIALELKRGTGKPAEDSCKNSLEKYNNGNAYRELTDNREMMLLGYILNDKNKAVTPCNANPGQGGIFENRQANVSLLGNVSLGMSKYFYRTRSESRRRREILIANAATSGAQRATFYPAAWIKMMWSNLFSTLSPLVCGGSNSNMLSSWGSSDSNQSQSFTPEVENTQSLQIPSLHRTAQSVPLDYTAQGFNGSKTDLPALSQRAEYMAGHLQGVLQLLDLGIRKWTGQKYSPQRCIQSSDTDDKRRTTAAQLAYAAQCPAVATLKQSLATAIYEPPATTAQEPWLAYPQPTTDSHSLSQQLT